MSDTQHPNYRLQDLQRRWERDPSSRVYQQLADEYRKAGQLVEAAVVLEDGLGRRPNDIAGRVALGRCRLELGQVPEAIEVLQNVIARDAAHHVANKLLLDAYLRAGDLVQARERLTIYRLINDGDPEIDELGLRLQQLESSTIGSTSAGDSASSSTPAPSPDSTPWESAPGAPASKPPPTVDDPNGTPSEIGSNTGAPPFPVMPTDSDAGPAASQAREAAGIEPPDEDAPLDTVAQVMEEPSLAAVTNRPQETLNMPNHAPDPKVNDVFDFGHEAPPTDSFASLWAELERMAPSIAADVAAVEAEAESEVATELSAQPVPEEAISEEVAFEASEPEPAPAAVAPAAAMPSLKDEPFADLVAAPVAEVETGGGDVWQDLALTLPQAEEPAKAETVAEPSAAIDDFLNAPTAPITPPPDPVEPPAMAEEMDTTAVDQVGAVGDAQMLAAEGASADGLTVEATPSEVSPSEVSPSEVSPSEVSPSEVSPSEVSPSEVSPSEVSPSEEMAAEVSLSEVSPSEEMAAEVSPADEPPADEPLTEASPADEPPTEAPSAEEDAAPTVTLGSLYLKQGHREEAARIFEEILRKEPGHQAALAGLNLARKPESSGLSAMDLLADRSLSGTIPAAVTAKKILVLNNYLQHLKARSKENHVH